MRTPSLQGKVAVVTGGSRGIGREIARALVAEQGSVIICGRDGRRAEQVAAEISRAGPGTCAGTACDVRRYAKVEALMRRAAETFGGLDILAHDPRSLPSRVEIRPTQPPKQR